jgi:hypothetical protein
MITNRVTSGPTRLEGALGFLEAAALSDAWIREMGHRAFILEAHHTTHIEGTRLTLAQAERLLEGLSVATATRASSPAKPTSSSITYAHSRFTRQSVKPTTVTGACCPCAQSKPN